MTARLARLTPDTPARWGSMSAHEMLCHLADSFRGVMGERAVSSVPASALKRRIVRLLALRAPLPWPKGIPTRPEVDPKRLGTPPKDFQTDRAALLVAMHRFFAATATYTEHPIFGAMSRADWLRWGRRHVDHHLRQFGL